MTITKEKIKKALDEIKDEKNTDSPYWVALCSSNVSRDLVTMYAIDFLEYVQDRDEEMIEEMDMWDIVHEWADGNVPPYTYDQMQEFASDIHHMEFMDVALAEVGEIKDPHILLANTLYQMRRSVIEALMIPLINEV